MTQCSPMEWKDVSTFWVQAFDYCLSPSHSLPSLWPLFRPGRDQVRHADIPRHGGNNTWKEPGALNDQKEPSPRPGTFISDLHTKKQQVSLLFKAMHSWHPNTEMITSVTVNFLQEKFMLL